MNKYPRRIWFGEACEEWGVTKGECCATEYISIEEHKDTVKAIQDKLNRIEQLAEYCLDDGYCDLYRNNLAKAIGYKSRLSPMKLLWEKK